MGRIGTPSSRNRQGTGEQAENSKRAGSAERTVVKTNPSLSGLLFERKWPRIGSSWGGARVWSVWILKFEQSACCTRYCAGSWSSIVGWRLSTLWARAAIRGRMYCVPRSGPFFLFISLSLTSVGLPLLMQQLLLPACFLLIFRL